MAAPFIPVSSLNFTEYVLDEEQATLVYFTHKADYLKESPWLQNISDHVRGAVLIAIFHIPTSPIPAAIERNYGLKNIKLPYMRLYGNEFTGKQKNQTHVKMHGGNAT